MTGANNYVLPDKGLFESGLAVLLWKGAVCVLRGGDLAVGAGWPLSIKAGQHGVSFHLASRAVAGQLDTARPRDMVGVCLTVLSLTQLTTHPERFLWKNNRKQVCTISET